MNPGKTWIEVVPSIGQATVTTTSDADIVAE